MKVVLLGKLRKALEKCLPGCEWKLGVHNWHVYPPGGGACFHVPSGPHGKGDRSEIKVGYARRMALLFKIEDCFQTELGYPAKKK